MTELNPKPIDLDGLTAEDERAVLGLVHALKTGQLPEAAPPRDLNPVVSPCPVGMPWCTEHVMDALDEDDLGICHSDAHDVVERVAMEWDSDSSSMQLECDRGVVAIRWGHQLYTPDGMVKLIDELNKLVETARRSERLLVRS